MRVLITGAAGFIGTWLAPELEAFGHEVIGVDLADGDLREKGVADRLVRAHRPEVVVHLAAQVGRIKGEDDVAHTVTSNALATSLVAMAAARHGARLTYFSTSEVYGDQGLWRCREDGPTRVPHNAYGLTKWWGEQAAALYAPDGLQVIRLSMPYGPGLPSGRGRAALINFLWWASRGEPLTVHSGSSRCWNWAGDAVRGVRLVVEHGEHAASADDWKQGVGVYNVGRDDNERTMLEVAHMACDMVGASHDLITEIEAPANQTVIKRLSDDKLRELGWAPQVDLPEGMARTWHVVRRHASDGTPPPDWTNATRVLEIA